MLRHKAKSAVFWNTIELLVRVGAGFVVTVILARLLAPDDFGVLALLALFLGIANLFANAGFSAALIQRQDVTHADESTVFWFNILMALLMMLALFAIAPWIASFFEMPLLQPLTMVMAINVLIGAAGAVQIALLTKQLDFKTLTKVTVFSTVISGVVSIYMAVAGYGVWALAAQSITATLIATLLLWHLSAWRPLSKFKRDSFRRLFGFGGWMFASSLLETIYQRGYTLLIGKSYGTYDLGIYSQAERVQQIPSGVLTEVLSRVAFPLFSSVNDDNEKLARGVRTSVRNMMLIVAPVMFGLAVLAVPFIDAVFGEKWLPAAPILQILCIVGLLFPLQVINLTALQAQGHSKLFFQLEVAKKITGVALLIGGSFFGIVGIAWSRVIQSVLALLINAHYTKRFLDYGVFKQLADCFASVLLSAAMTVVIMTVDSWTSVGGITGLVLLIVVGAGFYLGSGLLLRLSVFREAFQLLRK